MSNEWFARLDFTPGSRTLRSIFSMTSYNLLPPHLYDEWETNEFAHLASVCFPDATDEKMRCVLHAQKLS